MQSRSLKIVVKNKILKVSSTMYTEKSTHIESLVGVGIAIAIEKAYSIPSYTECDKDPDSDPDVEGLVHSILRENKLNKGGSRPKSHVKRLACTVFVFYRGQCTKHKNRLIATKIIGEV